MDYLLKSNFIDQEYSKFFCKCFVIKNNIRDKYNIDLTLRQFDNILIDLANNNLDDKNEK